MNPYENIFQELVNLAVKGELVKPKLAPRNRRERRLCKDGIKRRIRINPTNREYVQKFVSLMNVTPDKNKCWEWTGAGRVRNYGGMRFKRKTWLAHRLCLLFSGRDPRGKCACHHCDNPKCVNPSHLFIGTMKDNSQDMIKKGRHNASRGEDNGCCTTPLSTVLAIRKEYVKGVITQKQLAEKYNVTPTVVSLVLLRYSWKHV